jgi:hypothetical protein
MKMLVFALTAVTALTLAPATAFAKREGNVDSILFTCNMAFRATGKSIYIGLGWSNIKGQGSISCYDLVHGTTQILPIKVRVKGPGAGLGVTGLVLSGAVAGVGVQRGPEDLIGKYVAIRGNAAVGVGVGGAVGLRISKGGITVPVSVQGQSGLGVGVDLLSVKIESDGDMRVEQPTVVVTAPARQAPVVTAPAPQASVEAEAQAQASTSDDDDTEAQAEASAQAQIDDANASAAASAASQASSSANQAAAASQASAAVTTAPVIATAPTVAPTRYTPAPATTQTVAGAKSNVVFLQEGQPLQILDAHGRVIQTIYLKKN